MQKQDENDTLRSQGVNSETIFTDIGPATYALTFRDGGYGRMSDFCVALAAAQIGGLAGKAVADIGAGYGTTSISAMAWNPEIVAAVDKSPAMVHFMRTIFQRDVDITTWLRSMGADKVLEPMGFFDTIVTHFESMRAVYTGSLFRRQGDNLGTFEADALLEHGFQSFNSLDETDVAGRAAGHISFDAVLANNSFHWFVNQRLDQLLVPQSNHSRAELIPQAIGDALRPLRAHLKQDGVMVLMEPADFIVLDDNPEMDGYIEQHAMQSHPLYGCVQGMANEILLRDYGIKRPPAKRTTLFKKSELPKLVEQNGLELVGFHHVEAAYVNDPREVFLSRLPMHVGNVKELDFAAKLNILTEIHQGLQRELTETERQPVRPHWFFLVLKPI